MTAAELRAIAGKASRDRGESLECQLDAYHRTLAAQGRAWVRRIPTPVKVLGKTSKDKRGRTYFPATFDGRQGVDFAGFDAKGRHIVIEAKVHSGTGAWDCGIDPDGSVGKGGALGEHQWAELCAAGLAKCYTRIILQAWGSAWSIPPESLVLHVATVRRRTIWPDEIHRVGTRLMGVAWW